MKRKTPINFEAPVNRYDLGGPWVFSKSAKEIKIVELLRGTSYAMCSIIAQRFPIHYTREIDAILKVSSAPFKGSVALSILPVFYFSGKIGKDIINLGSSQMCILELFRKSGYKKIYFRLQSADKE